MSTHVSAGNPFRFDLRYVACNAFATRGAVFVVRVFCERRLARAVPRTGLVAIQTYLVRGLSELWVVIRAMDIMAVKACDATAVHHALHEVIARMWFLCAVPSGKCVKLNSLSLWSSSFQ